jgi:hypothetical protein
MKFILFAMFFVSPPAAPGAQVWTLQSTSMLEFATKADCENFGAELDKAAKTTDMMRVKGWCLGAAIVRVLPPPPPGQESSQEAPPALTIQRLPSK